MSNLDVRRAELDRLRKALPANDFFEKWLAETGALPPDFDQLTPTPRLTDPLTVVRDGKPYRLTAQEWPARRGELRKLVEDWLLGHAPPPEVAANLRAVPQKTRRYRGLEVRYVCLEFGPDHQAKLPCVLMLPVDAPGPVPVFLTESTFYRLWMRKPLSRQMAFCFVTAGDDYPDMGNVPPDSSRKFAKLFGDYDWSAFRRRGWALSRAVDWLTTLPEIDASRIYTGGHSRTAKQIMTAAAFDDRIAGVIASSPGAGGSLPYRYCDQSVFGESVEIITQAYPEWVHMGVRFFAGREHLLPADSHYLYALLAPRPVMMSTAFYDWVESTWTVEQTYKMTQPIYAMLGMPDNLAIRYRPHQHGWKRETCEAFTEFLTRVSRGEAPARRWAFKDAAFHDWDYGRWLARNPAIASPAKETTATQRVQWLLGDGPAFASMPVQIGVGESDFEEKINVRNWPAPPQRVRCRFGQHVNGQLYFPTKSANGDASLRGKLPGVMFLAPFACANGYTGSYRSGDIAHMRLLKSGCVLLAFDPLGTGTRQSDRRGFYDRNAAWSLMGRMVQDARHAVDGLLATPEVDPRKVYLVGYAMGGMTALLASALDQRVSGIVSIAGFTPFRTDGPTSPAGGVWRWSHLYGWLPRLGAFAEGREGEIPIDFDEILASMTSRPTLIIAPQRDRHAVHADVVAAVDHARRAGANVTLHQPDEWNRLTDPILDDVVAWIKGQ